MTYATYEWFLNHDLTEYAGKWVAIVDKEVVAAAATADVVIAEAQKKYPKKTPFITKVRNKLSALLRTY